MTVTLIDSRRDNRKEFESRSEAEEKRDDLIGLGASPEDFEIVAETDAEEPAETKTTVVDDESKTDDTVEDTLPDTKPSVDEDPVDWMPSHFVDTIQGVPTVNRKGYAVIASQYDVSVVAEPVVRASETENEYAEFKAIATTENGQEYSGFGSAHVDRQDGDDPHLLNELAETRAMKRAVSWATGIGMTAMEEMQGEL